MCKVDLGDNDVLGSPSHAGVSLDKPLSARGVLVHFDELTLRR